MSCDSMVGGLQLKWTICAFHNSRHGFCRLRNCSFVKEVISAIFGLNAFLSCVTLHLSVTLSVIVGIFAYSTIAIKIQNDKEIIKNITKTSL